MKSVPIKGDPDGDGRYLKGKSPLEQQKDQIWVEDLPEGQAWLVYHKKDSKDKPNCGRLIFDGIGGWKTEAKWLGILVKAAFNITENQEKKLPKRKRNGS